MTGVQTCALPIFCKHTHQIPVKLHGLKPGQKKRRILILRYQPVQFVFQDKRDFGLVQKLESFFFNIIFGFLYVPDPDIDPRAAWHIFQRAAKGMRILIIDGMTVGSIGKSVHMDGHSAAAWADAMDLYSIAALFRYEFIIAFCAFYDKFGILSPQEFHGRFRTFSVFILFRLIVVLIQGKSSVCSCVDVDADLFRIPAGMGNVPGGRDDSSGLCQDREGIYAPVHHERTVSAIFFSR